MVTFDSAVPHVGYVIISLQFMTSIQFKKKKPSRLIRISRRSVFGTECMKIERYTGYVLSSIFATGVLITLFVTFTGENKPPVNPFREGQNVLLPPEGNISLNTSKFPY